MKKLLSLLLAFALAFSVANIAFSALAEAETYTVKYVDGKNNYYFDAQEFVVEAGQPTPEFTGVMKMSGYDVVSWSPEVAEFVTGNVTYTANVQKRATIYINIYKYSDIETRVARYSLDGLHNNDVLTSDDILDLSNQNNKGLVIGKNAAYGLVGYYNSNEWTNYTDDQTVNMSKTVTVSNQANIYVVIGEWANVQVLTVTNDNNDTKEAIFSDKTFKGFNIINYLENNVRDALDRTGYSHFEWYKYDSPSFKFGANDKFNGWTNVLVKYTANEYTITFKDPSNESYEATKTVKFDEAVGELPEPERTGYTFLSWFDEAKGTQYTADTVYRVDDDITLTAHWQANSYNITFNPDGGELEESQKTRTVTYGTEVGALPVPTRTGYSFLGWFDETTGEKYTDTVYNKADDLTLTAHWQVNSYTITFNPDGGELDESQATRAIAYGAQVGDLPVPTKTGYGFIGWFDEATGEQYTAETVYELVDDVTLTAHWQANRYTITFNPGGGVLEESEATRTVTYGAEIGALPVPTRTGHTFTGWFNEATGEKYTDTVYNEATDLTLTARWEANSYTITFDPNGGALDNSEATKAVTYGEKVDDLPVPTRTGYNFLGWFNEATGELYTATVYSVDDDLTLTAHWEAINYTITFNPNGGELAKSQTTKTVTYGSEIGTLPVPIKAGYTFAGWFNEATGEQYTANTVYEVADDLTLTAHYKANGYTVTFDANIGSVTPATMVVFYNAAVGELPVPTKLGYTFTGWFDEETGEQYTAETVYKLTADLTLTAHWEANGKTYGKLKLTAEEIKYYVNKLPTSKWKNKVAVKLAEVALKLVGVLDKSKIIDFPGIRDSLYNMAADLIEKPVRDYWTIYPRV